MAARLRQPSRLLVRHSTALPVQLGVKNLNLSGRDKPTQEQVRVLSRPYIRRNTWIKRPFEPGGAAGTWISGGTG
jgi:hypothetical protein